MDKYLKMYLAPVAAKKTVGLCGVVDPRFVCHGIPEWESHGLGYMFRGIEQPEGCHSFLSAGHKSVCARAHILECSKQPKYALSLREEQSVFCWFSLTSISLRQNMHTGAFMH